MILGRANLVRFDVSDVTHAIENGRRHLVSVLRTRNLYPIGSYTAEIASWVIEVIPEPMVRMRDWQYRVDRVL